MKRKITQVGRLFAAAALFFGASSWASAQETVTATWALTEGGVQAATFSAENVLEGTMAVVPDFDFAGMEAWKNAAGAELDPTVVFTRIAPVTKHESPHQASITFTLTPVKGIVFTPTNVKVNAARFGSDSGNQLDVYVKTSAGSKKLNDVVIEPARSKKDDTLFPLYTQVDLNISDIIVENEPVTIEFWFKCDGGRNVGLNNLVITGTYTQAEPAKIAYLCDSPEYTDVVIEALKAAGLNVVTLNMTETSFTGDLTADGLDGYDLVVLGGTVGSKTNISKTFHNLIGKIPVLSTKAFWYGSNGNSWGGGTNVDDFSAVGAEGAAYGIVPGQFYKDHTVFDGLTVGEDGVISVFNASEVYNATNNRYMQGYTVSAETAPAHTCIATGSKPAKGDSDMASIGEVWTDGIGYMILAFESNAIKPETGEATLTEDGAKLFVNAVNYLLDGKQYEVPYYGDCTVSIDTVALTEEHAGKYQLVITATPDTAKIYYTIDGTEPTTAGKLYTAPDTIVKNCMIQAIAVADKWRDSSIDTLQFVNKSIETLPAPAFSVVQDAEKHCAVVTISALEGYTGYNFYYTTDGSEPTTASTLYTEPFEFYGETATVKAIAAGEAYNDSPVASQAVTNENYIVRGKEIFSTDFHNPVSEWFYLVDFTYDENDKPIGAGVKSDAVWPEGITYTDWTEKDHFRVHIFPKSNSYTGYRQYNNWSFYGEKGRRVILQDNKSMWCLGASGKVSAAPGQTFAGPFDIEVKISGTKQDTPIRIYVGDELEGNTWELIGEGTIANGESGTVVGSYNGTAEKYVRFESTATEFYVDKFAVKGPGYGELKLQSVSPAGGSFAAPATLEATATTFVLTFNNPLATTQGEDLVVYFGAAVPDIKTNCTYTVEGNQLTVTRSETENALSSGKYQFYVKGVKDAADQVMDGQVNVFYQVEGSSSVLSPEVEKTVVSSVIYSISGAAQSELTPGLNFVRTTYSDGTVEVEKVIKK